MGLPAIVARGFPGKREEAKRAGITPRIRVGTIDDSTAVSEPVFSVNVAIGYSPGNRLLLSYWPTIKRPF
jgi:hypothetical protein